MPDLAFLDFECSALAREGWPTEVAYVLPDGTSWSTLIKPFGYWTLWDPAMEALTEIHQADLAQGMAPADVCAKLETDLKDKIAYVTHPFDAKWLRVLFSQALGRNERLVAANLYNLVGQDGMRAYQAYILANPVTPQRALAEAQAALAFYQAFTKPSGGGQNNSSGDGWSSFQPPAGAQ